MKETPLIEQFSFFKQLHNFVFGGDVFSSVFFMSIKFSFHDWHTGVTGGDLMGNVC